MGNGKFEEMKGRAKVAGGELTDDEDLKDEGRADKAAGKTKQAIESAKDKASDAVDSVKDAITRD